MKKTIVSGIAALMTLTISSTPAFAADKPDPQATATTVWVDGKGQSSMARDVNKIHAKMSAEGWRFADMNVYTEDGDMKGIFVTYVRDPAAAAIPSP